jgi:hypothetical protein
MEQVDQPRPNLHIRDLASLYRRDQDVPLERPPESQHPANRQHPFVPEKSSPEENRLAAKELQSKTEEAPTPSVTISSVPADSPTLRPTTELVTALARACAGRSVHIYSKVSIRVATLILCLFGQMAES